MVAAKSPVTESSAKRWRVQAGVGVALVAVLAAWCFLRPNPQIAKVREMQKELFAKSPEKVSPDERKEKFEALRAEQEKLSSEERKDLRKELGQQFQMKAIAEAVAYLKMTPAERLKVIDEKIAREQAMQKKWAGKGGAPGGGAPGGKGVLAANAGTGGGGVNAAPSSTNVVATTPPGGDKAPSTAEERDARRREMLIHVSPEARKGFDQIRLDMAVRRAQLGLPPSPNRGPGPR